MNVLDVNQINLRNAYPTAIGRTIGQNGTAMRMANEPTDVASEDHSEVAKAVSIGGQSSAVIGGVVFLALMLGLMFLAKSVGTDDDFRSIKPSAYNVLTISLAAIVGIPVWKFLVTKFPIPGVSTWVLTA